MEEEERKRNREGGGIDSCIRREGGRGVHLFMWCVRKPLPLLYFPDELHNLTVAFAFVISCTVKSNGSSSGMHKTLCLAYVV